MEKIHRGYPGYRVSFLLSTLLSILVTLGALSRSEEARALAPDTNIDVIYKGTRPLTMDLYGGFAWWGHGFTTGGRLGIPILHHGFAENINNAVYINFGADFYYVWVYRYQTRPSGYYGALGFPVALHWEFYLTHRWSVFGEVGVNLYLPPRLFQGEGFHGPVGPWILAAAGGRLHFNDHVAITLVLGNPAVTFGGSFMFR